MNRFGDKLNGFVLLLVFVFTTLGSVPGFAWCIGEDGHFEIEYVATSDCGDIATNSPGNIVEESSVHFDVDHCGPCLDFYLQSHETISVRRLLETTTKRADILALNTKISSVTSQSVKRGVENLASQPSIRISQVILEHRKIVLLI
ncbi:MAG: hypothetical protein C0614_00090 [Desulfuromonas sp.]|nr:MAG: hypothetical protein C0614_00090 [Desulfuromonas sp.]